MSAHAAAAPAHAPDHGHDAKDAKKGHEEPKKPEAGHGHHDAHGGHDAKKTVDAHAKDTHDAAHAVVKDAAAHPPANTDKAKEHHAPADAHHAPAAAHGHDAHAAPAADAHGPKHDAHAAGDHHDHAEQKSGGFLNGLKKIGTKIKDTIQGYYQFAKDWFKGLFS
jgi:hypothetical protein